VIGSISNDEEKLRISHEQKLTAMRIVTDTQTAIGAQKAIHNLEVQRAGILLKLKQTHDPAQRMELEHQLKMTDLQIQNQTKRLNAAEKDKQQQLAKQKALHDQMLEAQKWFGQRFLDMVGHWIGDQMSKLGTMVRGWADHLGQAKDSALSTLGLLVRNFLDGIGKWKDSVILKVAQMVTDFITTVGSIPGKLGGLANDLIKAGAQIVWNIASGITGAIGSALGGAMSAVGSFISSNLPHSPAKLGPLRDLQLQGSLIPQQIAQGILAGQHHLTGVMGQFLRPMTVGVALSGTSGLSGSVAGGLSASVARQVATGAAPTIIINNVPPDITMDGYRLAKQLEPYQNQRLRYGTGWIG
jgi:hypothetical protein